MNWQHERKHFMTYVLFIITTAIWLAQVTTYGGQAGSGIALWNFGALFRPYMVQDPAQLWRLVTPIFVHLSWMHWAMNMFTLVFIGRMLEEIFGSWRFLGIYLLSGIFGNALTFFLSNNSISAGASTSLFGIFGAISMLGYFTGSPQLKQIGKSFIVLILINLGIDLFQSGINVVGHIGGAIGGGLLAAVFPPKNFYKWIPGWVKVLSGLTFVILLVVFVALPFL